MLRWQQALGRGSGAYEALVYLAVMPALRGALANEWRVRSSDSATQLLLSWRDAMPTGLWHPLFTGQVLPRLALELASWQPKMDPTLPHLWLHPWLPLLPPPGLAELFPQIRHKLAGALSAFGTSGGDAAALLQPWKPILDSPSWQALVARHVLPKMVHALATDFVVSPASQDLAPVLYVLSWAGTLPTEQIVSVLVVHFFPPWLRTLQEWLEQAPDYAEVSRWYLGWKSTLQERAPPLLHNKVILGQLCTALGLINDALADDGMSAPPPPSTWADETLLPPAPPPPPRQPPPAPPFNRSAIPDAESSVDLSLREVLEKQAAEKGLLFMPSGGRHDGQLIFHFGTVPVILDTGKETVRARFNASMGFRPTTITELLETATMRL